MVEFLALAITFLLLAVAIFGLYMSLQPVTCRHGTLVGYDCMCCKRELDELYEEEMKTFEEQHNG